MYLSLDTSTQNISLALVDKERVFASLHYTCYTRHSDELVFLIKTLLKMNDRGPDDLAGIIVGAGPGSFTGLRVGFSVVKAFLCARKLSVWAPSSFYSIFYKYRLISPKIFVLKDALRGNFYVGEFVETSGRSLKVSVKLMPKEVFLRSLIRKNGYLFTGESYIFKNDIENAMRDPHIVPCTDLPDAASLAQAVFTYLPHTKVKQGRELAPLYFYPEHWQVKKKEGKSRG